MSIKFVETVILCQSAKTDLSEAPRTKFHISLDEISRDHRYISYRQLESESQHSFNCLLDQMASTHISSLNLITVISCLVSICRQRPERLLQVITALETLHVNLPPTLGISQVKSVRKELKMHLLRMLKHQASFVHHSRIQQLLVELGATQSEINRAMPAPGEVKEALQRRVAVATASSSAQSSQTRSADDAELTSMDDSWRPKRFKLDEDDYVDDRLGAEAFTKLEDGESTANATQKAIEMTTDWVFGRLSTSVVAKLVMISLVSLVKFY
ncbi:symplekin [Aphelenchoides avenae]|nr:symplekin [Aphelenchus avenae]